MSSEFKFSIEWCTQLPLMNSPLESPTFILKGNEWFFIFLLKCGNDWFYELSLKLHAKRTNLQSCSGKFEARFKNNDLVLNKGKFKVSEHRVWGITMEGLKSRAPTSGDRMKFFFEFEDAAEPLSKFSKETVDRGIQTVSYFNTDMSIESLTKDFSQLFKSGLNHDIKLKCGEHTIKAHEIVLCTRSQVFKAMLQSDMLENRTGVVQIQDIDVSYFQDFIRYIYTDIMPELTLEKAKGLYEAGDKYAVKSLMLPCSEYLQDNLSSENAFRIFVLAHAHSDQELKEKVKTYVLDKKVYLQDEHWLPFCESFPEVAIEVYRLSHKTNDGK